MEYSKEFVTAVVLGKDLVPRQVGPCLPWPALGCPPPQALTQVARLSH